MIDKYKTCKDCPDRIMGCHSTCEGYLQRKQHNKKIADERKSDAIMSGYEFDQNSKYHTRKMKDLQRNRNRKR